MDSLRKRQYIIPKKHKLILKTLQRFNSERQNVFTKEINKIALSPNDNKRTHLIDSIETYAYQTSKYLVTKKGDIKFNKIEKQCKNN